jgi:uncharacterized membrane protein
MLHRVTLSFAPVVIVAALSAQPSLAQVRGAIGGAIVGGVVGGPVGALIGAGTGALIGRQGRRFRHRHYLWHGNCYFHSPSGQWYRVSRRYCR